MLPRLKEKISIERARMRLKAVIPKGLPNEAAASLRDLFNSKEAKIESEDASGSQARHQNCLSSKQCLRKATTFTQCQSKTESVERARLYRKAAIKRLETLSSFALHMPKDILKSLGMLQVVFVSLVDPGCFRDIHNFVQQISNGKGQVDVLSLGVMEQGDAHSQFDAWGSSQSERHARQVQEGQDPADRCLIALLLTFSCPKPKPT